MLLGDSCRCKARVTETECRNLTLDTPVFLQNKTNEMRRVPRSDASMSAVRAFWKYLRSPPHSLVSLLLRTIQSLHYFAAIMRPLLCFCFFAFNVYNIFAASARTTPIFSAGFMRARLHAVRMRNDGPFLEPLGCLMNECACRDQLCIQTILFVPRMTRLARIYDIYN